MLSDRRKLAVLNRLLSHSTGKELDSGHGGVPVMLVFRHILRPSLSLSLSLPAFLSMLVVVTMMMSI